EGQGAVSWIRYTRLAKRWNAAGGAEPLLQLCLCGWLGRRSDSPDRADRSLVSLRACCRAHRLVSIPRDRSVVPQALVRFETSADPVAGAEPALSHDQCRRHHCCRRLLAPAPPRAGDRGG